MQNGNYRQNDSAENSDDLAINVVKEVAQAKDVEPLDLEPLYEAVNPDVLNKLVTCSITVERVEFEYEGHTVTVRGDGHVHVK